MSGDRPDRYAGKIAELRKLWGGSCVMCGVPDMPAEKLEFAHLPGKPTGLDGRGRGLPQRYHDIRRNPGSYVLLCVDCHTELDGRGGGSKPKPQPGRYFGFGKGGKP